MTFYRTLQTAAAVLALSAGATMAQAPAGAVMGSDTSSASVNASSMTNGMQPARSREVSANAEHVLRMCQAMTPEDQARSKECKTFKARHPDMVNFDGSLRSSPAPQ